MAIRYDEGKAELAYDDEERAWQNQEYRCHAFSLRSRSMRSTG